MHRLTLATALALSCLTIATSPIRAQDAGSAAGRNLTIDAAPRPHHGHRRPPGRVQVSLMPVGPSTIAVGQPLRFRMVSLFSGFGHLYVLSASGRSQLWLENVAIRAGHPLQFPGNGRIVRAAAPAGDETVIFVASRNRINGFAGAGETTAPLELQLTHEGMRALMERKFSSLNRRDWAIAEIKIHVHE